MYIESLDAVLATCTDVIAGASPTTRKLAADSVETPSTFPDAEAWRINIRYAYFLHIVQWTQATLGVAPVTTGVQ
jgi:hypothetical protein